MKTRALAAETLSYITPTAELQATILRYGNHGNSETKLAHGNRGNSETKLAHGNRGNSET